MMYSDRSIFNLLDLHDSGFLINTSAWAKTLMYLANDIS